jgi:HD-GYP domain-containing protein (c-di-GMP phosphodiesterase class II)
LRDLSYAGMLHDIGRLTLPDAILLKDGPLSAEEYALVQCHPRAGAEFLASFPFFERAALWIAHHHERWDGAGYPFGLRGMMIPTGSRILAVADTFDALILDRPRGQAVMVNQVLRLLQIVAGSQLDPELVATFGDRVPGLIRHFDPGDIEHNLMKCNGAGCTACSTGGRGSSRPSDPAHPFSSSAGVRG